MGLLARADLHYEDDMRFADISVDAYFWSNQRLYRKVTVARTASGITYNAISHDQQQQLSWFEPDDVVSLIDIDEDDVYPWIE